MYIRLATTVSKGEKQTRKLNGGGFCHRLKDGMSVKLELHPTEGDLGTVSMRRVIKRIRSLHRRGKNLTIIVLESE